MALSTSLHSAQSRTRPTERPEGRGFSVYVRTTILERNRRVNSQPISPLSSRRARPSGRFRPAGSLRKALLRCPYEAARVAPALRLPSSSPCSRSSLRRPAPRSKNPSSSSKKIARPSPSRPTPKSPTPSAASRASRSSSSNATTSGSLNKMAAANASSKATSSFPTPKK